MENYTGVIHVDSNNIDTRQHSKSAPSNFVNYLTNPFYYDEAYEVAMTDIMFPRSWFNVPQDQYVGIFSTANVPLAIRKIPHGAYPDIGTLIETLQDVIECFREKESSETNVQHVRKEMFTLDHTHSIIIRNLDIGDSKLLFSLKISQILGISSTFFIVQANGNDEKNAAALNKLKLQNPSHEIKFTGTLSKSRPRLAIHTFASDKDFETTNVITVLSNNESSNSTESIIQPDRPYDIGNGIDQLFIYCDIIKGHPFGSTWQQILEVIPIRKSDQYAFGDVIQINFTSPKYYPLLNSNFDSIAIAIRDREGDLIDFKSGSVIIALDIRKKYGI